MIEDLREAEWRDLAPMARLEARCFPVDAWSETTFWAELAGRPTRSYWVATQACGEVPEHGARVVGYAGLSSGGEIADVMTIAVDPQQRGRRWGARLLGRLHDEARVRGAAAVMLEVRADNAAARRLYTATGYHQVHLRRGYYRSVDGGPAVDALVLRKELSHP